MSIHLSRVFREQLEAPACSFNQFLQLFSCFISLALILSLPAIDRGDIEFTVCELNCHNAQQDDQGSPVHERKPRFSSFKKSGAISKAVRNKLNLSKSSTQSTEKQNSCNESSSFEHEKLESAENGTLKESNEQSSASSSSSKSHPSKVQKKKSKLCLLLWPKQYSEDHV